MFHLREQLDILVGSLYGRTQERGSEGRIPLLLSLDRSGDPVHTRSGALIYENDWGTHDVKLLGSNSNLIVQRHRPNVKI